MCDAPVFTVVTFSRTGRIDEAECEESAVKTTMLQLWRDSVEHRTGVASAAVYGPDGLLVRTVDRRAEI